MERYPHLKNLAIHVAYPNLGLRSADGQRCVVFHHGHFIESIYHLMSTFKSLILGLEKPSNIEGIEAENFAWIDFFWSSMGRSGEVGTAIESIYEHLLHIQHFKKLLSAFVKNLADQYDLPGWGDWMEAKLLKELLHLLADKLSTREKTLTDLPLSQDAEKGLWSYVEGPLLSQILGEGENHSPSEVSFVFGHTHKPFQMDFQFEGYPNWVDVYNTGGWVVETVGREPIHGGAVVLVDEEMNLTSLRMYNESEDPRDYGVKVAQAAHAGQRANPFHKRVEGLVQGKGKPFKEFSETVGRAVHIRAQKLRARLKKLD